MTFEKIFNIAHDAHTVQKGLIRRPVILYLVAVCISENDLHKKVGIFQDNVGDPGVTLDGLWSIGVDEDDADYQFPTMLRTIIGLSLQNKVFQKIKAQSSGIAAKNRKFVF